MDLPIKFPTEVEVIDEEVARFRRLSPDEQVRSLNNLYRLRRVLIEASGRAATIAELDDDDEAQERRAIEEFVARHGPAGASGAA